MHRFFRNFTSRPRLRLGVMEGSRGLCRNPRFASFLAESNRKVLDTDLHDTVLRGRKFMRHVLVLLAAGGCIWVAIESAHALTVF